jgi:hypothetical protein
VVEKDVATIAEKAKNKTFSKFLLHFVCAIRWIDLPIQFLESVQTAV